MKQEMRFEADLFEGHKSVTAVLVPFDPEKTWRRRPVRLDPRRDGWLVKGTANGTPFEGYVGYRWKRFFLIIDDELRKAAKLSIGDSVSMVIEPTESASALAAAREQSRVTTAPKKGRPDAIDPEAGRERRRPAKPAPKRRR